MKKYAMMIAILLIFPLFYSNASNAVDVEIREPGDGSIFYTRNITIVGVAHACCHDKLETFTWRWEWENGSYAETIDLDGVTTYTFSINISLHYGWNKIYVTVKAYSGTDGSDGITIYYYGPVANANGPYQGKEGEEIQFHGSAYGGTEPYTYEWHFGDGSTSNQQNPEHVYEKAGLYHVKLIVIDAEGYKDVNYTYAVIADGRPPHIMIQKPHHGIYIFDRKILPSFVNIVIGKITIQAHAYDNESGIKSVAFYVDGEMLCNDTSYPYECEYKSFGIHDIVVKAYDYSLNVATAETKIIAI